MDAGQLAIPIESDAERQLQQQKPAIQPAVEGVALQVAGEPAHVLQGRDFVQHPVAVGPPQAPGRVVVVVGLVGVLVVVAVQSHPFDRAALAGQGSHQHQEVLQPQRGTEAAVGQHPVQPQGHPQHGGPIEHRQHHHGLPAPEARQQGKHRPHVHRQHETGGAPLEFALAARQGLAPFGYGSADALILKRAGCGRTQNLGRIGADYQGTLRVVLARFTPGQRRKSS